MSNSKQVVGIEAVNYVNKKNQQVTGVRLYCIEPLQAPHIGSRAVEVYISGASVDDFHLGEYSNLLYEPGYFNQLRCTGVLYK